MRKTRKFIVLFSTLFTILFYNNCGQIESVKSTRSGSYSNQGSINNDPIGTSIDGDWGIWIVSSNCDVMCGGGTLTEVRTCSNPAPSGGGKSCLGEATRIVSCNTQICSTNPLDPQDFCASGQQNTLNCNNEIQFAMQATKIGICSADRLSFDYGNCQVISCQPGYLPNSQNSQCVLESGVSGDSFRPRSLNDDVFFVGHSLVNTDMPEMVRKSVISRGGQASVAYQITNGAPLIYNWDNSASAQGVDFRAIIPSGQYEVVVITEAVPLVNHTTYSQSDVYAANFYNLAVNSNNQTQVYLYETWHCIKSGTPQGCAYDDNDNTSWRSRLDSERPRWEGIADAVNAQKSQGHPSMLIVPAGQAMAKMYDEISAGRVPGITSIDQLFSDDIHNNDLGLYFVAMVQYATIYGRNPADLPSQLSDSGGTPYIAPSRNLARKMQDIAWEVVCSYPRSGVNCQ